MAETAIDFILENLKQLMNSIWFDTDGKDQIKSIYKMLGFLRNFLKDSEEKHCGHTRVKNLATQIRDVAHEAEDIISSLLVSAINPKKRSLAGKIVHAFHPYHSLSDIKKEIKSITKEVRDIYDKKLYGIGDPQAEITKEVRDIYEKKFFGIGVPQADISSEGSSSRARVPNVDEVIVVGFVHEVETIKEQLTGLPKRLEVISIVGMAGLGKTTLARKLYNDPFIVYHFYIRGWTYVSQVYQKRDVLLNILSSVVEHKDEIFAMSDERLGEELYRRLKGKRYFIVIDDIWNIDVWGDLKKSFPNDNNGSRILFTSRLKDVALRAKPDSAPHSLPFLTPEESWVLLQQKVCWKESFPPEFMEIGRQIAGKCQGLPLAIVVVAGLLAKTDMTQDWWKQVAESIGSNTVSDPVEQCMDTLALSYNHLPCHLKMCFLYLGAFPEDYEIPVQKLTWLWIAEGFIQQIGDKRLEDVAEEHLMDLIDRSLVLVAKKRPTGGIRACRVHDLLRDLCLRKAKEENFLQNIYGGEEFSASYFFNLLHDLFLRKAKERTTLQQIYRYELRRLSIHSSSSSSSSSTPTANEKHDQCIHSQVFHFISSKPSARIRSLFWFATERSPLPLSFNYRIFKLLRVLDLSAIAIPYFPRDISDLVLLRYLALRGKSLNLSTYQISKLWNLETLVVSEGMDIIYLDLSSGCMGKLRHLHIAGRLIWDRFGTFTLPNLQTLSQVSPQLSFKVLERAPNLRKLGFCGSLLSEGHLSFPNLDFLKHLESLKLLHRGDLPRFGCQFGMVMFPPNLKRLTLSLTYLNWKEMSTLGMLPFLESLKLEYNACFGPLWETSDGGFRKLRYLRFHYMNIEQWNASSTHFPNLQHLVLHKCEKLKKIPTDLGDIPTLHTIDVSWCSHSTVNSVRQIQEEQQSNGNDWLQISINPPAWELAQYS